MAWRGTRRATRWMKLKSDIGVDIGGEDAEICLVLFCMSMWGLTCFCRCVAGLFGGRMCLY